MPDFYAKKITAKSPMICPSCGGLVADIEYVYKNKTDGSESFFYSCSSCTFIFSRPVLIPELSKRHMDGIVYGELFDSKLLKLIYTKLFIVPEIFKLKRTLRKFSPSLLDIGCGTGWITNEYKKRNFLVTGLEPSTERAKYASEKYGLKVINEYLENSLITEHYDVVMMRHVIEHFSNPKKLVSEVKKHLTPEGLLFLIVPNINSIGRYIFKTKWTWVLPFHCNFFTDKAIKAFMNNCGFEVLDCYQTPSPIYYPESLMRHIFFNFLKSFVKKHRVFSMLCMAPFPILGTLLGVGDNLNVIARVRKI